MAVSNEYFKATRHPWPCLWFLLPLLAFYEIGAIYLAKAPSELLRNGADSWVRRALGAIGLKQLYLLPVLLIVVLCIWSYRRRRDCPDDLLSTLTGMMIESVAFALGLWGLSRALGPLLDAAGLSITLSLTPVEQCVTYLGAGIYEESLFRLFLFSGLIWFFRKAEVSATLSVAVAALLSSTIFSAAHHVGPAGESFEPYIFLFRTLAGLYFAALYRIRGFGIAVGAHAAYDVAVGISL